MNINFFVFFLYSESKAIGNPINLKREKTHILMPKNKLLLTLTIFFLYIQISDSQSITDTFKLYTRLSFYTTEKDGEFLLHVPEKTVGNEIHVIIISNQDTLASWNGRPETKIVRIPFEQKLAPADYKVEARISSGREKNVKFTATTNLSVLTYKPNEVKTDRLTGGLIVNKKPFFPFGFYCYSPVPATLPEEEIIKGFNMISPYQKIAPETMEDRKAYMDRCAQIGMKVHYNLLSVSGGGGVGSNIPGLGFEAKRERLLAEIAIFRDHPALLGWYISDEPNGYKIPPKELEEIYKIVHENDPWHPISIVFMAPVLASKKYADALDIVMADPYPIPDLPASMIGNVAGQLKEEFNGKRPVWIVPQAFGGGELWKREPTLQEARSMTWQSIIKGATGIQYFVRQGANYFPKSTATWSECGRVAMEVAELTPWLLSDEKTMTVESTVKNILVCSRMHNGQLAIMAVNNENRPVEATFKIEGIKDTRARSLFENRFVSVNDGVLTDQIAAYGSQVYMIDTAKIRAVNTEVPQNINLLLDPGFEDLSSPGIPSACYARPGGDMGATYFLDSREHVEGNHSLRLITPVTNKSVTIRFFPVKLKAGASYVISLWAKSDPEQRINILQEQDFNVLPNLGKKRQIKISEPQFVELNMGEFCNVWFVPGKEWKQYITFVKIPVGAKAQVKANLVLRMPGQGVAWFDDLKIFEEKDPSGK